MKWKVESVPNPNESGSPGTLATAAMLALSLVLNSGCRLVKDTTELPVHTVRAVTGGSKKADVPDPVELQERLLRFADDYSTSLLVAIDNLNSATNNISPAELVRLKLNCVASCVAVATGPNATMNLLDMFVLVTLVRATVEEQFLPGAYGESARPMLEACRLGESNIAAIASVLLKPEQLTELRDAIAQSQRVHADFRSALSTRALGLAAEMRGKSSQTEPSSGSVFSLLRVDPLSGLNPATRELAQTRLFAERALFVGQRMPALLRWQTELLVMESAETSVFRELRTNTVQFAAAVQRFGKVAEELPALVRSEREAILKAVASQESGLTNVAVQLRTTLDAGRQMSDSVNTVLTTFDQLQQRLQAENTGKTNQPPAPSEPFRIQDYAETARRIEAAAGRLTELLRAVDQTLGSTNLTGLPARVAPVVEQARTGGHDLVNYTFRQAVLLVAITCALVVASALIFQRLHRRQN